MLYEFVPTVNGPRVLYCLVSMKEKSWNKIFLEVLFFCPWAITNYCPLYWPLHFISVKHKHWKLLGYVPTQKCRVKEKKMKSKIIVAVPRHLSRHGRAKTEQIRMMLSVEECVGSHKKEVIISLLLVIQVSWKKLNFFQVQKY